MVDESHDEGMLDESEYERLAGALGFTSRTVADVLLPLDRARDRRPAGPGHRGRGGCAQTGYSRFPVVGDDGSLVGYLHIKDVLHADPHGRARVVEDNWVRPFAERAGLRHAGQRAADAAGQGRAHGAGGRRRGTVARRGHPRGRHRGAGRRDPRRGARRRPLTVRETRPETSAVVGGPPAGLLPRSPPRAPRRGKGTQPGLHTFVVNRFFRTCRIETRSDAVRITWARLVRPRPCGRHPVGGRRRGTGTPRCAVA